MADITTSQHYESANGTSNEEQEEYKQPKGNQHPDEVTTSIRFHQSRYAEKGARPRVSFSASKHFLSIFKEKTWKVSWNCVELEWKARG